MIPLYQCCSAGREPGERTARCRCASALWTGLEQAQAIILQPPGASMIKSPFRAEENNKGCLCCGKGTSVIRCWALCNHLCMITLRTWLFQQRTGLMQVIWVKVLSEPGINGQ